jgi:Immunoglobulin domain
MQTKTLNQTGRNMRAGNLSRSTQGSWHLSSKKAAMRWILSGILSVGFFVAHHARSQDAVPYNSITNDIPLPTNAVPTELPSPPPNPSPSTLPESPSPTTDFQGLGDSNTLTPPDTDGAVGPNHVVTMLNTQVRIQNRAGTTNYSTVTLSNWWATKVSGVTFPFDPRILYDPYSGRWIATASAQPASTSSKILVAVSQSNDPTGSWYAFGLLADSSAVAWADFPTVGFNKDRVVISWNYYNLSNGARNGVGILALNKTNLYGGTLSQEFWYLDYATYGLGITPSLMYDQTNATFYLLQNFSGNISGTGYIAMFTITGAFGSGTLTRLGTFPSASGWADSAPSDGNFAPQLGNTTKIHLGDSRLSEVVYRAGSLWCAQTIFLPSSSPTRSAVQWWQIQTDGSVAQRSRLEDTGGVYFYGYPSIAVNRFGDAIIGYSRFATNEYARANYSFHAFNDPANSLQTEYLFKAGESAYQKIPSGDTRNRWGDYSMTSVDPVNDADFWTVQEYAATAVGSGNGSGRWGVWWANLQVAVPPNDSFASATVISGQQGTTNGNNVRATKETGEPNHASNSGGASVWYNWTAPASGSTIIDTIGSSFNTTLGIYTGSSVSGLTTVASDNDSGGNGTSKATFTATSGTTYRIAVDGFNGAMGNVVLNWLQPSAPVFTTQPQSQTKYVADSVTFTAQAVGNPAPGYQWRFNGSGIAGATNTSYTITGLQTNDAGNYIVVATNSSGSVTSAVAVLTILTSQATLSSSVYTNNQFQLTVSQVTNLTYIIQGNTNLSTTNWISLATNVAPFTFTDALASNYVTRFYRALYRP